MSVQPKSNRLIAMLELCKHPWIHNLWWRWMPGITIKVKWPSGDVVIDESHPTWDWTIGSSRYIIESADPNDHYRPELEKMVGHQGWDWNWDLIDNDAAENKLTIKFRKGKERFATLALLRWA